MTPSDPAPAFGEPSWPACGHDTDTPSRHTDAGGAQSVGADVPFALRPIPAAGMPGSRNAAGGLPLRAAALSKLEGLPTSGESIGRFGCAEAPATESEFDLYANK
jgi:hypothetical protein